MSADRSTDPGVIRNSWDDDETDPCVFPARLETRAEYLRRLTTELKEAREEIARLTPKPGCRVCGRTDCATT